MRIKSALLLDLVFCFCGCGIEVTQTITNPVSSDGQKSAADHAAMTLTSTNFQADVLDNSQVVLVDFWAPW